MLLYELPLATVIVGLVITITVDPCLCELTVRPLVISPPIMFSPDFPNGVNLTAMLDCDRPLSELPSMPIFNEFRIRLTATERCHIPVPGVQELLRKVKRKETLPYNISTSVIAYGHYLQSLRIPAAVGLGPETESRDGAAVCNATYCDPEARCPYQDYAYDPCPLFMFNHRIYAIRGSQTVTNALLQVVDTCELVTLVESHSGPVKETWTHYLYGLGVRAGRSTRPSLCKFNRQASLLQLPENRAVPWSEDMETGAFTSSYFVPETLTSNKGTLFFTITANALFALQLQNLLTSATVTRFPLPYALNISAHSKLLATHSDPALATFLWRKECAFVLLSWLHSSYSFIHMPCVQRVHMEWVDSSVPDRFWYSDSETPMMLYSLAAMQHNFEPIPVNETALLQVQVVEETTTKGEGIQMSDDLAAGIAISVTSIFVLCIWIKICLMTKEHQNTKWWMTKYTMKAEETATDIVTQIGNVPKRTKRSKGKKYGEIEDDVEEDDEQL